MDRAICPNCGQDGEGATCGSCGSSLVLEDRFRLDTELGVRVSASSLSAELTGFVNRVSDYIYLRPFGSGGGAFDSLQVVQGDARLVGVEGRVAYRAMPALTLQLSGDWVRGQNLTSDVPLTFVPPPRLVYGVRLEPPARAGAASAPYLMVSAESNARQTRLDPRDVGPPGYTLVTVGGGVSRLTRRGVVTLDLTLRNALDAEYRSFMSRYKEFALAAGRALVVRVSVGR